MAGWLVSGRISNTWISGDKERLTTMVSIMPTGVQYDCRALLALYVVLTHCNMDYPFVRDIKDTKSTRVLTHGSVSSAACIVSQVLGLRVPSRLQQARQRPGVLPKHKSNTSWILGRLTTRPIHTTRSLRRPARVGS